MVTKKKIRALVVDDALLMRKVVADILDADPEIEVIDTAYNGESALKKIRLLKPDVVTLDVEMPIVDGITCLKEMMKTDPTPAVMISSVTYEGGMHTLQALDAGAFDFVEKPKAQSSSSLKQVSEEIVKKVKAAVSSRYIERFKKKTHAIVGQASQMALNKELPEKLQKVKSYASYVIGIGVSTGGPPCVSKILSSLTKQCPPVLVVQHMPENFTKAFADRLDRESSIKVVEASNGMDLQKGTAYIAPGNKHMMVIDTGVKKQIMLNNKDKVSGHRPSADVLFSSIAKVYRDKAIGVILTGMGKDGAENLQAMYKTGAHTIAQSKESCVVFGMPKAAIELNAIDEILSLEGIILRLKQII